MEPRWITLGVIIVVLLIFIGGATWSMTSVFPWALGAALVSALFAGVSKWFGSSPHDVAQSLALRPPVEAVVIVAFEFAAEMV